AHRAGDLGQTTLDRHVDVLVLSAEREAALVQLALDRSQAPEQQVAVLGGDDAPLREHLRVGARLSDVLRPQAPIELDRRVQAAEIRVLGLVEARHGRSVYDRAFAPRPSATPRTWATRAIWPSLMWGKKGSASERAATSSQTGNSPSRWPNRSR